MQRTFASRGLSPERACRQGGSPKKTKGTREAQAKEAQEKVVWFSQEETHPCSIIIAQTQSHRTTYFREGGHTKAVNGEADQQESFWQKLTKGKTSQQEAPLAHAHTLHFHPFCNCACTHSSSRAPKLQSYCRFYLQFVLRRGRQL